MEFKAGDIVEYVGNSTTGGAPKLLGELAILVRKAAIREDEWHVQLIFPGEGVRDMAAEWQKDPYMYEGNIKVVGHVEEG